MVKPVDSRLPAVFNPLRTNKTIVVALAVAAIGFLLIRVIKSLVGRTKHLTAKKVKIFIEQAKAHRNDNKPDAALADFERALNCNPAPDLLLQIYFYRGSVFAEQKGSYEAAIADFDKALKLSSSDQDFDVKIFIERARAHSSLGHYKQSLADLNAAYALNSQNPILRAKILAFRVQLKIYLKQLETILNDLDKALDCPDPGMRSFIYELRGDYYLETKDDARALHDYNQAIDCKPSDEETFARVVYKRGSAHENLQHRDDALEDFTKAIQSNFSNDSLRAQILNRRAMAYSEREEYKQAVDDLTRAINLPSEKTQLASRYLRASAYLNWNRFSESIQDFTFVLGLCPNDKKLQAEILYLRGNAYRANHQKDLARADFEKALSHNSTEEGLRKKLVDELAQLKS